MPVCSKCGAELPNDAKFCFSCGAPQHTADEKEFFFIRNEKDSSNAEGTFTDPRDGEVYKTCKIGDQIWMAENLRYRPPKGGSYPYDKNKDNVAKYGRLYEWTTVEDAVPPGWVLPSDEDVEQLKSFIEKSYDVSDALRSEDWDDGMDVYGFNAVPSGFQGYEKALYDSRDEWDNDSSGFRELNERAVYWADERKFFAIDSDSFDSVYGNPKISYNRESGWVDTPWNKYEACAIRCIKNTPQRLLRLKEAIDQKRIQAEEEAKKARAERLAQEKQELDRERDQAEQARQEKRNGVIKSIIVGVVISTALIFISQDFLVGVIFGVGCILHSFFTPIFKDYMRIFILGAIISAAEAFLGALLASTYSALTFATAFIYSFAIATPLMMFLFKKLTKS